jgi:hypothetical protein
MRKLWSAALMVIAVMVGTVALASTPLKLKPTSSFDMWQVAVKAVLIGAMGVVAVAGGLYVWRSWRRAQGMMIGPNDAASVEWARRVTPRTTLLVVRWQGKRYLLAENSTHTTVVDTRALDEVAS